MQDEIAPRSLFMLGALLVVGAFFASYGRLGGHESASDRRNLSLLSTELGQQGVLALGMRCSLPGHIDLAPAAASVYRRVGGDARYRSWLSAA